MNRRVLKSSKDNLNALLKRGQAFFFMGDSENAIKNLQQGLKYDPDNKLMREQFKVSVTFIDFTIVCIFAKINQFVTENKSY